MKTIITVFTCILLFTSCGENSRDRSAMSKDVELNELASNRKSENGFFNADTVKQLTQFEDKKQPQPSQPPLHQDWDKKIIKTASIDAEVKDYSQYYSFLREKVKSFGGYIAQEEQKQSDYKIENTLSIKVPVDQFDNAVYQLTANVEKLNERKVNSQDVSSEFVDTRSRLEARKQMRLRYLDLLKQAKNMEEILNVQGEINNIQEEIESAAGRLEYLGHSSTFSTINLTYFQVLNAKAKNTDSPSLGTKLGVAFRTGWTWVGDLFVGLVSIWPLLLMIFTLILFFRKWRMRGNKVTS